ncbi:MAG: hypothetical protein AAF928_18515 [Myxococcota bacterium]
MSARFGFWLGAALVTSLGVGRASAQAPEVPRETTPAVAPAAPSDAAWRRLRRRLEYYRQHHPAYYERHFAPLLGDGASLPAPVAPAPRTSRHVSRGGMVGGETDEAGARTLRGHTFVAPRLVPGGAFAASSLYVATSAEWFRQTGVEARGRGGEGVRYDRNLALLRLRYGFDYAVHERLALGLDADFLAAVGANQRSILLHGGETGLDARPFLRGVVVRDLDAGTQLAVTASAVIEQGIRATPQNTIDRFEERVAGLDEREAEACLNAGALDAACSGLVDEASALSALATTRARRGGGGAVTFAQALGSMLGVQLGAAFEHSRLGLESQAIGEVTATDTRFLAGLAPTLDLGPHFPVGAALAYRFEYRRLRYDESPRLGIPDGSSTLGLYHRTTAVLYYTGRRDLMLGWTGGVAVLQDNERAVANPRAGRPRASVLAPRPDGVLYSGHFELRYFF